MTIELSLPNYRIPSVQLFIDKLVDDLANSRSVLILLPSGVLPDEVWPLLRSALWNRDFDFEEVILTDLPNDHSPLSELSSALQVKWPSAETPRTSMNFLKIKERMPDAVYLEGFNRLTTETRKDWLTFLSEWVQSSHRGADQGRRPMALCIIAGAIDILDAIPETDIHLGVYWWWGFPSALEIKMLCRLKNENDGHTVLGRWREYLLPTLVGSDISLLGYLWDAMQFGVKELVDQLIGYSEIRGWETECLEKSDANGFGGVFSENFGRVTLAPSEALRKLWAIGALYWTPEYGLQLNSAALALMGKKREILHRIWRGQAELLLPILDQVRLKTCDHMTNSHGKSWPYRWKKPNSQHEYESVRKDPLACQLGYLEYLLKTCKQLQSDRIWLSLVVQSRTMRNDLAHYRPIDFRGFKMLMREIDAFDL